MKKAITPANSPNVAAFPLSHGITDGNYIFTSGQIHMTGDGKLVDSSFTDKTDQVMSNLKSILVKAGSSFDDVVKVTVYITDFDNYAEFNDAYAKYFKAPFPVREVVGVADLPAGADLEVSVIAKAKSKAKSKKHA